MKLFLQLKIINFDFKFSSVDKNPNNEIFDFCIKNNHVYDAFVFLTANDSNHKTILKEINEFRVKKNKPNTKYFFFYHFNFFFLNEM